MGSMFTTTLWAFLRSHRITTHSLTLAHCSATLGLLPLTEGLHWSHMPYWQSLAVLYDSRCHWNSGQQTVQPFDWTRPVASGELVKLPKGWACSYLCRKQLLFMLLECLLVPLSHASWWLTSPSISWLTFVNKGSSAEMKCCCHSWFGTFCTLPYKCWQRNAEIQAPFQIQVLFCRQQDVYGERQSCPSFFSCRASWFLWGFFTSRCMATRNSAGKFTKSSPVELLLLAYC